LQLPNPLSSDEIAEKLVGVVDGVEIPGALLLEPMKRLSYYFPEAPVEEKLHLVVQGQRLSGH